jgi:hypothetical protein
MKAPTANPVVLRSPRRLIFAADVFGVTSALDLSNIPPCGWKGGIILLGALAAVDLTVSKMKEKHYSGIDIDSHHRTVLAVFCLCAVEPKGISIVGCNNEYGLRHLTLRVRNLGLMQLQTQKRRTICLDVTLGMDVRTWKGLARELE